jgi:hypothetical protein
MATMQSPGRARGRRTATNPVRQQPRRPRRWRPPMVVGLALIMAAALVPRALAEGPNPTSFDMFDGFESFEVGAPAAEMPATESFEAEAFTDLTASPETATRAGGDEDGIVVAAAQPKSGGGTGGEGGQQARTPVGGDPAGGGGQPSQAPLGEGAQDRERPTDEGSPDASGPAATIESEFAQNPRSFERLWTEVNLLERDLVSGGTTAPYSLSRPTLAPSWLAASPGQIQQMRETLRDLDARIGTDHETWEESDPFETWIQDLRRADRNDLRSRVQVMDALLDSAYSVRGGNRPAPLAEDEELDDQQAMRAIDPMAVPGQAPTDGRRPRIPGIPPAVWNGPVTPGTPPYADIPVQLDGRLVNLEIFPDTRPPAGRLLVPPSAATPAEDATGGILARTDATTAESRGGAQGAASGRSTTIAQAARGLSGKLDAEAAAQASATTAKVATYAVGGSAFALALAALGRLATAGLLLGVHPDVIKLLPASGLTPG